LSYIDYIYQGPEGLLYAVLAPFLDVFGYWFFAILYFLAVGMIWIRGQDITLPVVLGIIVGAAMSVALPAEAHMAGYILIGLGMAVILYRVMRSPG